MIQIRKKQYRVVTQCAVYLIVRWQELRRYPEQVREVDDADQMIFQLPLQYKCSRNPVDLFSAFCFTGDLVMPQAEL